MQTGEKERPIPEIAAENRGWFFGQVRGIGVFFAVRIPETEKTGSENGKSWIHLRIGKL